MIGNQEQSVNIPESLPENHLEEKSAETKDDTLLNKLEVKEEQIEQLLTQVDAKFSELENLALELDDAQLEQKTEEAIIELIKVMNQAKAAGLSIEKIRALLPNAYRVHGYSSFIDNLRRHKKQQGHFSSIDILVDKIETGKPDIEPHLQKIGKIIGNLALECPLAQQHREKLKIQAETVKEVCEKVKSPNITMIASGSARDLEQIQQELIQSNAKITLVDIYPDALDAALDNLREFLEGVKEPEALLKTVPVDVLSLFRTGSESSKRFRKDVLAGNIDALVAGGLFDYFKEPTIRNLLKTLSAQEGIIKEGGIVLFTNLAADVDDPWLVWADIIGHWHLRTRTKKAMEDLQEVLGFSKNSVELDPTGLTWIARSINKKP